MRADGIVIDVHSHFVPKEATTFARRTDGTDYNQMTQMMTGKLQAIHDIDRRVALMEEAGVDMVVFHMSPFGPLGKDACRALNDGCAEALKTYPDKFIPCAHVALDGSPEVLDGLDHGVNELGFKGVSILSSTSEMTIDSEKLFPLYEKISELDLPIVVHPTVRPGIWGGEKYRMEDHVAREYDIAKATIEVLYGVLPRFPELKFIMPHFGGGMPALLGRVVAHHEPKGWDVPHKISQLPKTPRELRELGLDRDFEELFGKVYIDTAGFGGWMPITEAAVKTVRSDRLCFGTDYPFEIHEARDVKSYIDNIKALDISEEDKRNILGENVKRLFRL